MIGIVDADIYVFKSGFAAEKKYKHVLENGDVEHKRDVEPLSHALHNLDNMIRKVGREFKDGLEFYLTGKDNFRKKINPDYKANRSPFSKPYFFDEIREHLVKKYGAIIVDGMEADDAIGLRATDGSGNTCIVTIDKDLDQIEGPHYNFDKEIHYNVSAIEGLRSFYRQMLTGDRVDNVPGIDGVGPVTAAKLINALNKEHSMAAVVKAQWYLAYPNGYKGMSLKDVLPNLAELLWIQRTGREQWKPK